MPPAAGEKRVILLVGPTCVGKTGVSISLAKKLATEIISADSMQIYRHMDIGTEKPSPEERQAVRHHMIDIVEPTEGFSAGRYAEAVVPIVEGLHAKGKIPLFVGGTGLYIKAMTRGLFSGPGADRELREELATENSETLYMRLRSMDPEAAGAIEPGDTRRIVRALEVCLRSGKKISEMRRAHTAPLPWSFLKIALTRDRKELYRMIEKRVESMVERGLIEEVRNLVSLNHSETPLQAIGYKELAGHFRGEYSLDEAVALIKRNTKRYAKRQFTWFRKEEALHWVDVTGIHEPEDILARVLPLVETPGPPHEGADAMKGTMSP
jgi:tRNA dimethylallyltransferase